MNEPTIEEIMANTGVSRNSAIRRRAEYRDGRRSLAGLYVEKGQISKSAAAWGNLGLGPRKRVEDIQGPTDAERRLYGLPPATTSKKEAKTMAIKKPTKPETELLAKLQLEVAEKEKLIERLAAMLGCLPGDIEQAMATMQAHVQEIRDIVEPEVADAKPANLPEACRALVAEVTALQKGMAERDRQLDALIADADKWQKRATELKDEWCDAKARIAQLEDEATKAWTILDGAGAGTLIEVAEKRWKELETAHNTIKRLEREIEDLAAAAAVPPSVQDGGEAAGILRDLMCKLVDGRISLIHNP